MTFVLLYVLQGKADYMTKIVPNKEKVKIKWIVWHGNQKEYRSKEVMWGQGYDFECSCGYESRSGGAIFTQIQKEVYEHKLYVHDYDFDSAHVEKKIQKSHERVAELKEQTEKVIKETDELLARLEREANA
jgi:hypothetical protein